MTEIQDKKYSELADYIVVTHFITKFFTDAAVNVAQLHKKYEGPHGLKALFYVPKEAARIDSLRGAFIQAFNADIELAKKNNEIPKDPCLTLLEVAYPGWDAPLKGEALHASVLSLSGTSY